MNEPHDWARKVFGAFANAYTDNLGGDIWTLSFDEESFRKIGLTRQQAAAGLQLLKDQGLIRLMTRWGFRLTPRGMQACAAMAYAPLGECARDERPSPAILVTINADTIQNAQIGDGNIVVSKGRA